MIRVRLHHVAMAVQDRAVYERATTFYKEVIGLSVLRSWGTPTRHITMLSFGNGILEMVFGAEGKDTGVFSHVALSVERPEDVDVFLERCLAAGCELTSPAEDMDVIEEGSGKPFRFRKGFCRGLAGETLEIFCER
ncbi:VOC family protein [Mailhella sp.]|uniref:VOC family protein n=1 Tax=Mailhella sp. TaxID=1981029 RepID=UPI003AB28992